MGKEHWIETTLGQIATHPQYGWTTKAGRSGKYKYFRTTDIDSTINWGSVPYCVQIPQNPDDYTIRKNDILVSRAGSIGYNIRFNEDHLDTLFASYLIRFRPIYPIESKLISYYLQTKVYWSFINESQSGIAVPNVNATKLSELPFPLPPLGEQKRIVEKLDTILPKVRSAKARLEKIPVILKKFRQSVLAAACSGGLTEDWREGRDLPDWEDTTIGNIAEYITSGSRGWARFYSDNGALFIRAQNISHDKLDLSDVAHVQLPEDIEGMRTVIQQSDILITITGANVTKSALVHAKIDEAYVNQHVALVRLKNIDYAPFVYLFLISEANGRKQLQEYAYGIGKPGLNLQNIKDVIISLPSITEQCEIITRVEKLFTLADSLEYKYNTAVDQVNKIEHSVLAKAFRGELVDPDPDDEPAEELLKRIIEEKIKMTNHNTNKTRKVRR